MDTSAYDVFLVIGQSNTHWGYGGVDPVLDAPQDNIVQLGLHGENNLKVIPAKEPLDHHTKDANKIGFALTFAKAYAKQFLASDRKVLIIPGGFGGTGFVDNRWNKGDDLYNFAVYRTNYILEKYPNSKIKAILWHQGEADVQSQVYQSRLDAMIVNLRNDLGSSPNAPIPFILGGMVPYWVDKYAVGHQENIIKQTVNRLPKIGYADPRVPFVITKLDNAYDEIHFNAEGQREMGRRYFAEYTRVAN
ncbi:sialate O-acetylesterase [Rufibacter sp. XAAS-G3-1]|uniref:sialate O-acetylesterase n=1 Tax=Rufibacter sp. XAAS-G3-1 TaxID=2729134 RepID=UPI0015E759F2